MYLDNLVAGLLRNKTHPAIGPYNIVNQQIYQEKAAHEPDILLNLRTSSNFSYGAAVERANRRMGNWVKSPRAFLWLVEPNPICKFMTTS